ncbi:MAG TPA: hypothetical protein VF244_02765, partial [Acidimicrobiales bacterium]
MAAQDTLGDRIIDRSKAHNRAVSVYAESLANPHEVHASRLHPSERAILALLGGLDAMAWDAENVDPFAVAEIWGPLFDGANTALNYETGRLDCGTLSAFLRDL